MWKGRLKLLVLLNHTSCEDSLYHFKLICGKIWSDCLSFLRTKMNRGSKNWKHSAFYNNSGAFMIKRPYTETFANFWSASLFMNKHTQLLQLAEESKREANHSWREGYHPSLLWGQDPATLRGRVHGWFMQKTGFLPFLVKDVGPGWESSLSSTQFKLTLPCCHLLLLSWSG